MVIAQGGGCAICHRRSNGRALDVDHDHANGAIRGLLCVNCNMILGYAHDDTDLLLGAIKYLRNSGLAITEILP
jgi:hypothetical protein